MLPPRRRPTAAPSPVSGCTWRPQPQRGLRSARCAKGACPARAPYGGRSAPPTLADMAASESTHLDPLGRARMVDVTAKEATHRRAVARCRVHMEADTAAKIASGAISKGDVLAVARVAGIQAAKQTPNLLPLCHPLLVGAVYVNFRIEDAHVDRKSVV